MKITATVVWRVSLEVDVKENATLDEKRDAIYNEALKAELDFKSPIIHECSEDLLID